MFLYHRIPQELRGTKLYPLTKLKETHQDLYTSLVTNYFGREEVMKQIIPIFECLWNDVIFLSPVAPSLVTEARRRYGLSANHGHSFVIDSHTLDKDKLLLYRHRPLWLVGQEPEKEEYVRFSDLTEKDTEELSQVPECARWSMKKFGEKNLFFGYIPHILYLGEIDIVNASILEY